MAAGKNVVATRVDAIPTLIDDGEDGLLVNADNREEAWKGSYGCANIQIINIHDRKNLQESSRKLRN